MYYFFIVIASAASIGLACVVLWIIGGFVQDLIDTVERVQRIAEKLGIDIDEEEE
jgi:hypothetical protein